VYETTHKQTILNPFGESVSYEYPAIKSAVRIRGVYKSFMRTYGTKRTKEQAIELVAAWELENPLLYKTR